MLELKEDTLSGGVSSDHHYRHKKTRQHHAVKSPPAGRSLASGGSSSIRKRKQGRQEEEILDLPIPGFVKTVINPIMGNYLYKSDSFEQVMRKMALLVWLLGGCASLGPTINHAVNYQKEGYLGDLLSAISGSVICVSILAIYLAFRLHYKHVSDTMATLLILSASQLWTCLHFASPQFYALLWIDMMIMCLAIIMNIRGLVFIGILHTVLVLQDMYNESFRDMGGGFALQLPVRDNVGIERFLLHLMCFFPGFALLIAIWFVSQEQKRQVQAANKSVDLAQRIVKELRQYNTEKVQDLVSQALESGDDKEINKDLIQSFSAMVVNLEKYRPFLPNYLFLSSSSGEEDDQEDQDDDDDDEGSLSLECMSATSKQNNNDCNNGGAAGKKKRRKRRQQDKGGGGSPSSMGSESVASSYGGGYHQYHLEDDEEEHHHEGSSDTSFNTSNSSATANQSMTSVTTHSPAGIFAPSAGPSHSGGVGTTVPGGGGVNSFRGVVSMALVEVKTSQWFHASADRVVGGDKTTTFSSAASSASNNNHFLLSKFTDTIFEVAKATKASIHSMLGDTIQLSWNATHRVAQPELKAAQMLLQMKVEVEQVLGRAGGGAQLAGAACSGVAEVHSVFSSKSKQFALFVDAHWLPALTKMSQLAVKHRTILVDSNTKDPSSYNVTAQAVDCLKYRPRAAVDPVSGDWQVPVVAVGAKSLPYLRPVPTFGGDDEDDNDGNSSSSDACMSMIHSLCRQQKRERPQSLNARTTEKLTTAVQQNQQQQQTTDHQHRYTLVYELTSLLDQNDHDEWMYQLNSIEKKRKAAATAAARNNSVQAKQQKGIAAGVVGERRKKEEVEETAEEVICLEETVTNILMLAVEGKFGEAVEMIEKIRELKNSQQYHKSITTPIVQELFTACETQLQL